MDGPNKEAEVQPEKPFKVEVVDSGETYSALDRAGKQVTGIDLNQLTGPTFEKEVTKIEVAPPGKWGNEQPAYTIDTQLPHTQQVMEGPDSGFYSLREVDAIKNFMEGEGVQVGLISRRGQLRDLIAEQDGICVLIQMGSKEDANLDEVYQDQETAEALKKVGLDISKNRIVWLTTIEKDSLVKRILTHPPFPESPAEFDRQLKAYAKIYESFLNGVSYQLQDGAAPQTLDLKFGKNVPWPASFEDFA